MKLTFKHTKVFTKNKIAYDDPSIFHVINQGGTRSSKSWSISQLFVYKCLTTPGLQSAMVRKSFPALRASAMRDFFKIIDEWKVPGKYNKTENIFYYNNGSTTEFFSVDSEQKTRGRKRDIINLEEANELTSDEHLQLKLRTTTKMFYSFNPSDNHSWIYELKKDIDAVTIKSTYKDNPFLDPRTINSIERLIYADPEYYKVFALGEQASLGESIITHYKEKEYLNHGDDMRYYGLDLGFNHPSSLVEVSLIDNNIYAKELIYSSKLTTSDLIELINKSNISKQITIVTDSARPDVIEELNRAGYYAVPALKDVTQGINALKSRQLFIDPSSTNLLKELKSYKWKKIGDMITDQPVKLYDDAIDALRYAVYYHHNLYKNGAADFSFLVL